MGRVQSIYGPLRPHSGYGDPSLYARTTPIGSGTPDMRAHGDVGFLKWIAAAGLLASGGGVLRGGALAYSKRGLLVNPLRSAWNLSGTIKRPVHSFFLARAQSIQSVYGQSTSLLWLSRTMNLRKKGNMVLLGLTALNPLETVYYAKERDYWRLFVNYHLPFIGVPLIGDWFDDSPGSGAPEETPQPAPTPSSYRPDRRTGHSQPSSRVRTTKTSTPEPVFQARPSPGLSSARIGRWTYQRQQRPCPPGFIRIGGRCVKIR